MKVTFLRVQIPCIDVNAFRTAFVFTDVTHVAVAPSYFLFSTAQDSSLLCLTAKKKKKKSNESG